MGFLGDMVSNSPTLTRIGAGADLAGRILGGVSGQPGMQQPAAQGAGLDGIRADMNAIRTGSRAIKRMSPDQPILKPSYMPRTSATPDVAAPMGQAGLTGVL